jgi:hypothetical protein
MISNVFSFVSHLCRNYGSIGRQRNMFAVGMSKPSVLRKKKPE